jgi:hypothetical protein
MKAALSCFQRFVERENFCVNNPSQKGHFLVYLF